MAPTAEQSVRDTAGDRRANIIGAMLREFDTAQETSAVCRFAALLDGGERQMLVSADIDGLVSAAMLAHVTGWRAVGLVVNSELVLLHPDIAQGGCAVDTLIGVDIFSTLFPNVSNHPILWGDRRPANDTAAKALAVAYDEEIRARADTTVFVNPSLWTGIQASYPDSPARPRSARYRYPFGTAQVMLAVLEAAGRGPKMFDREYLPWLIANCDGGVRSIREYAYNASMWWSCLAAAVGPGSLSEQLYALMMRQHPTEFADVVNRLRAEGQTDPAHASKHLDGDWNLAGGVPQSFASVAQWLTSISGWPDPILGGSAQLAGWSAVTPPRGVYFIESPPAGAPQRTTPVVPTIGYHLASALQAVHAACSFFYERKTIGWLSRWPGLAGDSPPLPAPLQPFDGVPPVVPPGDGPAPTNPTLDV